MVIIFDDLFENVSIILWRTNSRPQALRMGKYVLTAIDGDYFHCTELDEKFEYFFKRTKFQTTQAKTGKGTPSTGLEMFRIGLIATVW